MSRKDSSDLKRRIFYSSVPNYGYRWSVPRWLPLLPVSFFHFITHALICKFIWHMDVSHWGAPLVPKWSVCAQKQLTSLTQALLSLFHQSRSFEYLLLQSGLTGDHFIHQTSVCIFEPREGFIPAADQCLNSVTSSA